MNIVGSEVSTALPTMFIFAVQPIQPAGLVESRISLVTLVDETLTLDGIAPPPAVWPSSATFSTRSKAQRRSWPSTRGRYPRTADCSAPLHLVQHWGNAARRATVKPVYDDKTSMLQRFRECGEIRMAFADQVVGVYLQGFNFRVILKLSFPLRDGWPKKWAGPRAHGVRAMGRVDGSWPRRVTEAFAAGGAVSSAGARTSTWRSDMLWCVRHKNRLLYWKK
jgi:hypothetical protein